MCCCRRFLRRFEPVTIKMAKDQNLFLNPAKISGVCGRLLCCLAYEKENYSDFQRRAPKLGRRYMTTQGPMKTLRANMFRDSVSVLTENGDELDFSLTDWAAMVLPDQPRMASGEESSDDVPAELAALMDPEVRGRSTRQDRKSRPPRRDQRQRPGGERGQRSERAPKARSDSQGTQGAQGGSQGGAQGERRQEQPGQPRERKEGRRDKRRRPGPRKEQASKPPRQ
jgi:hypothetical protein